MNERLRGWMNESMKKWMMEWITNEPRVVSHKQGSELMEVHDPWPKRVFTDDWWIKYSRTQYYTDMATEQNMRKMALQCMLHLTAHLLYQCYIPRSIKLCLWNPICCSLTQLWELILVWDLMKGKSLPQNNHSLVAVGGRDRARQMYACSFVTPSTWKNVWLVAASVLVLVADFS